MERVSLSRSIRVQPFTGLVIDVETWNTAHDYHRRHQQLHLLTLHGSGIASGLEVLPSDPPSDTLVVQPGVAIDPVGNVMIVPESQRLTLEAKAGLAYLALDYVESMPPNSHDARGRLLEDFRMRALSSAPEDPALELARVQVNPSGGLALVTPSNPWSPGPNEIDGRYRPVLRPQAPRDLSVALVICGPPDKLPTEHLRGFQYLLRELRHTGVRPVLSAADPSAVPDSDLIYVTGVADAEPDPGMIKAIVDQAKKGRWVLADGCGSGTSLYDALKTATKELQKTGAEVRERVLGSHFVFGAAPEGATKGLDVVWCRGAVLSGSDFGCVWAGGRGKQVFSREQIRSALEFGVNVAVCAAQTTTTH